MAMAWKIKKLRRKFSSLQKQTFIKQETICSQKYRPKKQVLPKCDRKYQNHSSQKQLFLNYDSMSSHRLKQPNQLQYVPGTMVQVKQCSVMLERINIRDLCEYNVTPKQERSTDKNVAEISQIEPQFSVNNIQMPLLEKFELDEKFSATYGKQMPILSKTKCKRKYSACKTTNSSNTVKVPVKKSEPLEKFLVTPEKQMSAACKSKSRRKCSIPETQNSLHIQIPVIKNFPAKPEKLVSSLQKSKSEKKCFTHEALVKRTKYSRKHIPEQQTLSKHSANYSSLLKMQALFNCNRISLSKLQRPNQFESIPESMEQIIPCSVILKRISDRDICKYSRIPKREKLIDKKVAEHSQVEPSFVTNNVQIPLLQKLESDEKFLNTSGEQTTTIHKTKSRRKYKTIYSSNTVQVPIVKKSEPSGKFSDNSEKRVSSVHKKKSRRKGSIPKTQNSSSNIQIHVVEKFSATPEKLISKLQKTKSNRKCATQEACVKKFKYSRKCVREQQALPKDSTNSLASLQKETNSKCNVFSVPPKGKHSNNCAKNVPIDELSFRINSLESHEAKKDDKLQKQESQKFKPRKKSSTQTKRVQRPKKQKLSLKKQKTTKRVQSKKKTSVCTRKLSCISKKSTEIPCSFFARDTPIDDLVAHKFTPENLTSSNKTCLKNKRNEVQASEMESKVYEDDIYEFKKFDKFKELFVDTSMSPVPSSMPTPELGYQLTPRICQDSPKFVDCISPTDYALYRKVAEECMSRRYPARIGANANISITL